jgi:hypothetical protein
MRLFFSLMLPFVAAASFCCLLAHRAMSNSTRTSFFHLVVRWFSSLCVRLLLISYSRKNPKESITIHPMVLFALRQIAADFLQAKKSERIDYHPPDGSLRSAPDCC